MHESYRAFLRQLQTFISGLVEIAQSIRVSARLLERRG